MTYLYLFCIYFNFLPFMFSQLFQRNLASIHCKQIFFFFFSPKDPLRCSSPVAMETSVESDPLRVNASMQPESECGVNGAQGLHIFIRCKTVTSILVLNLKCGVRLPTRD